MTRLLEENRARYSEHPNEAAAFLGIGEAPIALDGAAEELAAWTMVARALLNLSESITRN